MRDNFQETGIRRDYLIVIFINCVFLVRIMFSSCSVTLDGMVEWVARSGGGERQSAMLGAC